MTLRTSEQTVEHGTIHFPREVSLEAFASEAVHFPGYYHNYVGIPLTHSWARVRVRKGGYTKILAEGSIFSD